MKISLTSITTNIILCALSLYAPCSAQETALNPEQSSPLTYTKPRVSIVTSVFDPKDMFIEQFLIDITRQTIFGQCELILIEVPCSPNTKYIIEPFLEKYPNIRYIQLDTDPGLYGVWNIGIQLARADFITNANIDDRRNPSCLEMHAKALEENPDISLVYSDFYCTRYPNTTFEKPQAYALTNVHDFSPKTMYMCLAGPMPMWRKSIHDYCGYFRSDLSSSADWEFWCRMASIGCTFKKITGISGVYYVNPKGASTDQSDKKVIERNEANKKIAQMYIHM